jgi:hypothetical protein
VPLTSHEVRWFFKGAVERFPRLHRWITTVKPLPAEGKVEPPRWDGNLKDRADVYLLVPGSDDMGIKWRQGQLQIKGRVSRLGTQVFCGRFPGRVEVWAKWSYKGAPVDRAFRGWFEGNGKKAWSRVTVRKRRILRKVRLDAQHQHVEVSAKRAYPDRGLNVELTDLRIGSHAYCSVGFEAFPDDSGMPEALTRTVEAFLESLRDVDLEEKLSMGYPQFLRSDSGKPRA